MRFETFGPFSVPLTIDEKMTALCGAFEETREGLSHASGVYIFAKIIREQLIPIYVGRTNNDSFGGRIPHHFNQPRNQCLAAHWNEPSNEIYLFLIALMKSPGSFRDATSEPERYFSCITRLEDMLIGSCLRVNSDLCNMKGVEFHRDIYVPGYLNSSLEDEDHGASAISLAKMLQK